MEIENNLDQISTNKPGLLQAWLVSRLVVLGLAFAVSAQTLILPVAAQNAGGAQKASSARPQEAEKPPSNGQPKTPDKKSPPKPVAESRLTGLERKWAQQARTLLDGVLATAYRVEPIEWRCLVEVEAGTLLWPDDKERATSIFKSAIAAMREQLKKEGAPKATGGESESRAQRFWFFIVRRIAALKPDLLRELVGSADGAGNPLKAGIKEEWTPEARALISLAYDRMESDPKFAAQLAEKSMSLGYVDWTGFLEDLSKRDEGEAERLAMLLLQRLRDSSASPLEMRNLGRFILAPERSAALQNEFFRSLAVRIRRDLQPDVPLQGLTDDLRTAREMGQLATLRFPQWAPEFGELASALEMMFTAQSRPIPGPPQKRMIDVSSLLPSEAGETQSIADELPRVTTINDDRQRDKEYQRLARQAAAKENIPLAEDILSKINDVAIRREATLTAYSPLVRKAISQSNWPEAQRLAARILDPLGRTLVFDRIAQAMLQAHQEKAQIKDIYLTALARLDREDVSEQAARAFLFISRPLYPLEAERSTLAIQSAIAILNQLFLKTGTIEESSLTSAASSWIRLPNYSVNSAELLDLTDLLQAVFREMARRDSDAALSMAYRLSDWGLYSLARLAISRELIERRSMPLPRRAGA
ncbi:MAG TPA: hypothetical protein VJ464_09615 [Blastocatellia bacterium]|nr:hypothetical protein [Blastocatellia bacterium]